MKEHSTRRGQDSLRRWARDLADSRFLRRRGAWLGERTGYGWLDDGRSSSEFSPWNSSSWSGFSPWHPFSPGTFDGHPHGVRVPPKDDQRLRFFSLNVAHGRRNSPENPFYRRRTVQRNISAVADTVKALGPDIVALQEADGPSSWSGNFDHVASLAEQAELMSHYRGDHNSVNLGRFNLASGTALLSRRPLQDPLSHRFGMSWRDTKGFVVATVPVPEWDDLEVDVVSVHLDFLAPRIRRKQILHMVEHLVYRRRPMVLLGDLNCCFEREPASMELLADTLGLRAWEPDERAPTFPSRRPRRRLDWILISDELEFGGHHTVHVPLSDHLVLVADIHHKDSARASAP